MAKKSGQFGLGAQMVTPLDAFSGKVEGSQQGDGQPQGDVQHDGITERHALGHGESHQDGLGDSLPGADITGGGRDGGGQVGDAVQQHEREEADHEGKGVHHEPVFGGLEQPDDDRGQEDHQDVEGRTQRGQPVQELVHDAGSTFTQAGGQQVVDEPGPDAQGQLWEHGSQQKDHQCAHEGSRTPQGQGLDIADEARFRTGQFCQLGQVDEDKGQHDHPVKDALHDDGSQRSGDGHALPALEDDSPQHFPGPGRVDVVAHITDGGDGEHGAGGDLLDRAEQVMPAPGPDPDPDEVDR